jgi:hypothetical protein
MAWLLRGCGAACTRAAFATTPATTSAVGERQLLSNRSWFTRHFANMGKQLKAGSVCALVHDVLEYGGLVL